MNDAVQEEPPTGHPREAPSDADVQTLIQSIQDASSAPTTTTTTTDLDEFDQGEYWDYSSMAPLNAISAVSSSLAPQAGGKRQVALPTS